MSFEERRENNVELYEKVSRMYHVIYENGLTKSVRDQEKALKVIKEAVDGLDRKIDTFIATRSITCPTALVQKNKKGESLRTAGVVIAAISATAGALRLFIG